MRAIITCASTRTPRGVTAGPHGNTVNVAGAALFCRGESGYTRVESHIVGMAADMRRHKAAQAKRK